MPATVSGDPRNFKPDFNIGFRFDDVAFMPLSIDEKNAMVDSSAVRIAKYFSFFDPEDEGEPDAPTIWLPNMKELSIQVGTAYNRDYGAPEPYFTMMIRFSDDPSQNDPGDMPRGQVKARIENLVGDIVIEIAAIESEESLPITATIDWL